MRSLTASKILSAFTELQEKQGNILTKFSELLADFKSSHGDRVWTYAEMEAAVRSAFRRWIPRNPLTKNQRNAALVFIAPDGYEGPIGDHTGWIFHEGTGQLLANEMSEVLIVMAA